MKKLLFMTALGVAGLVSAKDNAELMTFETNFDNIILSSTCVGVESDCGEYGFACGERNVDGELDHEVIDEVRQLLNEAFCGYGD